MYISDYCERSKEENKYVVVSFMDMDENEPGIDFDVVEPVFDEIGNLVGYLFENDFYSKEQIRWFRIQKEFME